MAVTVETVTQQQLNLAPSQRPVPIKEVAQVIPGQKPWVTRILPDAGQYRSHLMFAREIELITAAGADAIIRHPDVGTVIEEYKEHLRRDETMPNTVPLGAGDEGRVVSLGRRTHIPLAIKEFTYSATVAPSHERAVSTVVVNEALRSFLENTGDERVAVPKHLAAITIRVDTPQAHASLAKRHAVIMEEVPGTNFQQMLETGTYNDGKKSFRVSPEALAQMESHFESTLQLVTHADRKGTIPGLKAHTIPHLEWVPKNCVVYFRDANPQSWKLYILDQGHGRTHFGIA